MQSWKSASEVLILSLVLAGFGRPGYANSVLLGYWTFNETSGTTAPDVSGNGDNGTLSATGAAWGTGVDGGGAVNLSLGGFVNMGNPALLALGSGLPTSWTVQAWINTTQASTSAALVAGEQVSGINQGYVITMGNFDPGCTNSSYNGKAAGYTASGGGLCFGTEITQPSNNALNDGNWHQVVLVDNNGFLSLYVDSTLQNTDSSQTGTTACPGAGFVVGGGSPSGTCNTSPGTPVGSYAGLVTDVGVWSVALTSSQIDAAFLNPNNPFAATAVPEPASFATAVFGLGILCVLARRRHIKPTRRCSLSMRGSR